MQENSSKRVDVGLNELEVIEFMLKFDKRNGDSESQSYGINVTKVREIIRLPEFTAMPKQPEAVRGIFSLRDQIIPAVDLVKVLYGQENTNPDSKVIVAEFNSMQFGFIVSDVARIHQFPWTQVEAPDAVQDLDDQSASIIGIIKMEDKNILMVDVEKIIADINPSLAMDSGNHGEAPFGTGLIAVTADDSATIRKMLNARLKLAGFTIESHRDGQEAWDALSAKAASGDLKGKVDIVVTDIEMPQMDGYTLVRKIKEHPTLSEIPVVIFSSIVSEDIRHKGEKVGADAQMAKPQISLLLDTVKSLLQQKTEALA